MLHNDLNTLLSYRNDQVVARYDAEYPDAKMPGVEALNELLKYIWLCNTHYDESYLRPHDMRLHFDCVIHVEMQEIDAIWHVFLLFTRDYQAFCNDYLNGVFFHHEPLTETKHVPFNDDYTEELTRYLSYIYDNLGEKTLLKWFSHIGLE